MIEHRERPRRGSPRAPARWRGASAPSRCAGGRSRPSAQASAAWRWRPPGGERAVTLQSPRPAPSATRQAPRSRQAGSRTFRRGRRHMRCCSRFETQVALMTQAPTQTVTQAVIARRPKGVAAIHHCRAPRWIASLALAMTAWPGQTLKLPNEANSGGLGTGPTAIPPGCTARENAYISSVGQPTMAINGAWNRRSGPGGSTRRLHQFDTPPGGRQLWGRIRIDARSKGASRRSAWYRRYRAIHYVPTTIGT